MSGSAIEWSPAQHDRDGARGDDLADGSLDRLGGAGRVGRDHGRVAEVDDAELGEAVDARLQVRAGRAARGADRPRPEAGPGPVGDEVVGWRPDDRDVDARELGRVLRVGHAAEAEQPREVGLVPQGLPALERIDHSARIMSSDPPPEVSRDGSGGGAGGARAPPGRRRGLGRAAHEQPGERGADREDHDRRR